MHGSIHIYCHSPEQQRFRQSEQFGLIDEHRSDPKTGLCYHGSAGAKVQNWADERTGRSANFWSRAVGWWEMAKVETLESFPKDHPARSELAAILKKTAEGIVKGRDPDTGL